MLYFISPLRVQKKIDKFFVSPAPTVSYVSPRNTFLLISDLPVDWRGPRNPFFTRTQVSLQCNFIHVSPLRRH